MMSFMCPVRHTVLVTDRTAKIVEILYEYICLKIKKAMSICRDDVNSPLLFSAVRKTDANICIRSVVIISFELSFFGFTK